MNEMRRKVYYTRTS